jgi:hypothetical protein
MTRFFKCSLILYFFLQSSQFICWASETVCKHAFVQCWVQNEIRPSSYQRWNHFEKILVYLVHMLICICSSPPIRIYIYILHIWNFLEKNPVSDVCKQQIWFFKCSLILYFFLQSSHFQGHLSSDFLNASEHITSFINTLEVTQIHGYTQFSG